MSISHCERFATVSVSDAGFACSTFQVNPGLGSMFPWLCDVANRFDKYKFRSIKLRYIPAAAANAGTVALAFDFDPNDDAPTTMSEATTFHDYVMTSIWQGADLVLDLANGDKLPQKNTRPGMPGANLDLNVYDVGQLHLLTEGAATGVLGYLEVIYSVDLFVHQVQAGVGGTFTATDGTTPAALFGTSQTVDAQAHLPGRVTAADTFTFTQPFEGLVALALVGTTFASTAITNTGTATFHDWNISRYPNANTSFTGFFKVRASVGQTLVLSVSAVTVTQATFKFARATYTAL